MKRLIASLIVCAAVLCGQTVVIGTIDLTLSKAWSAIHTWTANGVGSTPTERIRLQNATAAAAGAQQWSPCVYWEGQGWKTDATAGSQKVEFRSCLVPVQGAANPEARLAFDYAVNGAAFGTTFSVVNNKLGIGTIRPSTRLSLGALTSVANFLVYDGGFLSAGGNGFFAGFGVDFPNSNSLSLLAHHTGTLQFGKFTSSNDISNATTWMTLSNNAVGIGPGFTSPTVTLHVYDATTATGVTRQILRAGAGQSTDNLLEWRNNADALIAHVSSGGAIGLSTGSPLILEGATADAFETTVVVTDPTAARTFTLPNANSAAIQPLTCSGTDKVSAVSALGVITCAADVSGGAPTALQLNVATATGTYNATTANYTILCDTSGGSVTVNLPAVASACSGANCLMLNIKKTSASNTCTVDGDAAETIDGSATIAITDLNVNLQIQADGSNWRIL